MRTLLLIIVFVLGGAVLEQNGIESKTAYAVYGFLFGAFFLASLIYED